MPSRKVTLLTVFLAALAIFLIPFISYVGERRDIGDWPAWQTAYQELSKNWIRLNLLIQPEGALIALETKLANDPAPTLQRNAQSELTNCLEHLGAKSALTACRNDYIRLGETKKIYDNYLLKKKNYLTIALAWRRSKKALYDACDALRITGQNFAVSGENDQTKKELLEAFKKIQTVSPVIDEKICAGLNEFKFACPESLDTARQIDPPDCRP